MFHLPTSIIFGDHALLQFPQIPLVRRAKRIDCILGMHSARASGILDRFLQLVSTHDAEIVLHEGVSAEPTPESAQGMISSVQNQTDTLIVAIGGGSVIDVAKVIGFCAMQPSCRVRDALRSLPAFPASSIPVIAIPTTAGTGSEVTPWSVLWDREEEKKYSLAHPFLFPAYAIVDPVLTYSTPASLTAVTGMDAFTQACEAYWNRNSNSMSDDLALSAIRRIYTALPLAVKNGQDASSRHAVMLGSLEAGMAFSQTRTAACHSISYPMTIKFGVPHGQAVALTLPSVLVLNAQAQPERAPEFCKALGAPDVQTAADGIRQLMQSIHLSTTLSSAGMTADDIEYIIQNGFTPARMDNNPFRFTAESLRTMLHSIL